MPTPVPQPNIDAPLRSEAMALVRSLPRGAVRFNASGERLDGTSPSTTTFTITGWVYVASDTGNESSWVILRNAGSTTWILVGVNNAIKFQVDSSAGAGAAGTQLVAGKWYHFALTRGSNSFKGYIDGSLSASYADSSNYSAATTLSIGYSFGFLDGRLCDVRVWDGYAMGADEIKREMRSLVPVRWRNLKQWHPLRHHSNARLDYSGLRNHLTAAGTLTTEPGPPLPLTELRRKRGRAPVATGGTTYSDSVTLSQTVTAADSGLASAFGTVPVQVTSAVSDAGTASALATVAAQITAAVSAAGGALVSVSLPLSQTVAVSEAGTATAQGAVTAQATISVTPAGTASALATALLSQTVAAGASGTALAAATLALQQTVTAVAAAQAQARGTLTLTDILAIATSSTGLSVDAFVTIGQTLALAPAGTAQSAASLLLSQTVAASPLAAAQVGAAVVMQAVLAAQAAGLAQARSGLSLGLTVALTSAGTGGTASPGGLLLMLLLNQRPN